MEGRDGARDEAEELCVQIIWKGLLKEDARDEQIKVVEDFTTQRVDGIVLAPLEDAALRVPVENAQRSGHSEACPHPNLLPPGGGVPERLAKPTSYSFSRLPCLGGRAGAVGGSRAPRALPSVACNSGWPPAPSGQTALYYRSPWSPGR